MYTPARLHEVIYVSTMAPTASISIVADIAPKARVANQARDITGLLIFDGMRFCQQLEGRPKEVLSLMERICKDPRHTNIEILHQGPLSERRFRRFSLGYIAIDEVDVLQRMEQVDGQVAVDAFMALLPVLDMES